MSPNRNPRIVVLGSIILDLIAAAPRLPCAGETVIASGFVQLPGGKGANQAVAAGRLGASVQMLGRVGRDDSGTAMLESLQSSGVDTTFVERVADAPTGLALIGVNETNGDNQIIVVPGANSHIMPSSIRAAADAIAGADALLCSLEVPLETVEEAIEAAASHGVCVLLNPAPARQLPARLLSRVSVLIPNEHEAALLVGGKQADTAEIARSLVLEQGVGCAVVTLGEAGSLAVDREYPDRLIRQAAFDPGPIADTVGAGDCFCAALTVALSEGRSLREAMRFASAAAAISVSRPGAQPAMPTRAEVEAMLISGRVYDFSL